MITIIACWRHTHMGVIFRSYPVRGELHIQHNANIEVAPRNLFLEFVHELQARPDSLLRECGKPLKFIKDLKGFRLNGGV